MKKQPTDEFIKVNKYLITIFAVNGIPLTMIPISLIFAQRMELKTNVLYLLKGDKNEIAEMMNITLNTVEKLITKCKKYDIIRPADSRGKYVINPFLFSTGSVNDTRNLQTHFCHVGS